MWRPKAPRIPEGNHSSLTLARLEAKCTQSGDGKATSTRCVR